MTEDLAQSEGMTEWVPVLQILGNIPLPVLSSTGSLQPAGAARIVPLPPNLHWAIVLILGLVTRQLFNLLWASHPSELGAETLR